MKNLIVGALVSVFFLTWSGTSFATFDSGSTGADGAFNPSADIEVVLPSDGILNYTTVYIPAGVTVTFQKNQDNTPVYMLATGDVDIAGTINVSGSTGTTIVPGEGGPGGYPGGFGAPASSPGGTGLGPGGGLAGTCGSGGGYGAGGGQCYGSPGGTTYGNERIIPLLGGSGGGGGALIGRNGGGGGGAILIASSTTITITGNIYANAGAGAADANMRGGSGSGGAIKLVANVIAGDGIIKAEGISGLSYMGAGGSGRIRLETYDMQRQAATSPAYSFGEPSSIFPPAPSTLSITAIGANPVPANPTGSYTQPDLLLPDTTVNPVSVDVSATNVPVSTTVNVWVIPQYGSASSTDLTLSGTDTSSSGTANVTLSTQYSNVLMAETTFTIQAFIWDGEKVEKVKLAARPGEPTRVVYLTESGKEIPGNLFASLIR